MPATLFARLHSLDSLQHPYPITKAECGSQSAIYSGLWYFVSCISSNIIWNIVVMLKSRRCEGCVALRLSTSTSITTGIVLATFENAIF